jgi:cytochrome bd-type quinol oxidase subunit 2
VGIAGWAFIRSLKAGHDSAPFLQTLLVFLLCFIGLGISIYPYVIPGAVTIWGAATKRSSQIFMLVAWRSSNAINLRKNPKKASFQIKWFIFYL